ncbi:hypothetical protein EOJ36_02250 [Sandaracinomonas limnophila]|uniref:DUF5683 domain-containing protein n=1 Tax=Sandaracinomonas limnophila TaxID=1862386 RepID=A0A437PXA5_9BACT|nr:DUF5683 domain-containing protein [Sandaracinomonas limnophila]RVU26838.1 hypothetical protein EOJ36_02250 [Sandaracinomonas limnophila]
MISRSSFFFLFLFLSQSLLSKDITIDTLQKSKMDTISLSKIPKHKIIPRVATIRSLILPGLGQAYNRQYWKLPLVAGAFITLGLIAKYNNDRYQKYKDYYWIVSPHPEDTSYSPPSTVSVTYEDGVARDLDANQLKRIVDGFHRNRDYTYIGMFVAWAFNVVDANVSAHLRTFDISDDISLKLKPKFDFNPYQNNLMAGINLTFQLK